MIVEFLNSKVKHIEFGLVESTLPDGYFISTNSETSERIWRDKTKCQECSLDRVKEYTSQIMTYEKFNLNIDIDRTERIIRLVKLIRKAESI